MQKLNKTYPVTETIVTGVVYRIKDSVVYNLLKDKIKTRNEMRIVYPGE